MSRTNLLRFERAVSQGMDAAHPPPCPSSWAAAHLADSEPTPVQRIKGLLEFGVYSISRTGVRRVQLASQDKGGSQSPPGAAVGIGQQLLKGGAGAGEWGCEAHLWIRAGQDLPPGLSGASGLVDRVQSSLVWPHISGSPLAHPVCLVPASDYPVEGGRG